MDCSQLTAVSWWMKEEWVRGCVRGEGVVLVVSECVFLSAFFCMLQFSQDYSRNLKVSQ